MTSARPRLQGFTLVELLVVLVLLSLIVLAMASALRTASQTEERVDARLQQMDDLRTVSLFLRSVLARVSAEKTTLPVPQGRSPYYFTGTASTLTWVGVMPARHGAGGLTHFRLSLSDDGALGLHYRPWSGPSSAPDWSAAGSSTLLTGVTAFDLHYEDAAREPPAWTPEWSDVDHLPSRVSLVVQTRTGAWPELAIALRVLPGTDPRANGPIFGGSLQ